MERMRERRRLEVDEKERMEIGFKRLCFFSEEAPGLLCQSFNAELQVTREWLRALGQPDVQTGESLRQAVHRAWTAWINYSPYSFGQKRYAPGFNRLTQEFDRNFGFEVDISDIDKWIPPDGDSGGLLTKSSLPFMLWREKEKQSETLTRRII